MSQQKKSFIVWLIIGLFTTAGIVALNWYQDYTWPHMLCDGFFTTAVFLLGLGGLKFVRNQGVFDMMSYSISNVFQIHYPFSKMDSPLNARPEEFVDYKERKRAKRKGAADLVWAGVVYIGLSLIMLVVYFLTV